MTNMVKCFTVRQAQPKFSWHPSEITCIKCHLMESDSDMKCMRALWWAEPVFWSIRRLCLLPPAPQPPHCWTDPANHPPLQAQPITSTAGKMKMRKGAVEGSRSYTSNTFFYRIPWISPLLSWPYISNREGMQCYDCNYRLYYLRRLRRNVCNQSEVASSAIFYIVVVGAEERAIANKLWKKVRKADQWLKEHLSWTLCRQWQGRGRQVGHAEPSARF